MILNSKKEKQVLDNLTSQNFISQGTKIIGDFISEGDLRIDGTIEGNIKTAGKVVVGKSGVIKGNLEGTDAYFEGKFLGKLTLEGTLTLKETAQVEGDVVIGKLAVEPGAAFNATCVMRGVIKDINGRGKEQQKSTERTA